jgi:DNA-binding MarR family transcriptional regulator
MMIAGSNTAAPAATTESLGFLLAKASARWNERLARAFAERGFPEVRPAWGSVLLPLFEQDGLRMGDVAQRSRLAKQTLTTLVPQLEHAGLVERERDPDDARAWRLTLTARARELQSTAEEVVRDLDASVAEHLSREATEALRSALKGVMEL